MTMYADDDTNDDPIRICHECEKNKSRGSPFDITRIVLSKTSFYPIL